MKNQLIVSAVLGSLLFTSLTANSQSLPSSYVMSENKAGLTAFIYGKRTVLEFSVAPGSLSVSDEKGFPVQYERISEKHYRLAQQLENFSVNVGGQTITFKTPKNEVNTPRQFEQVAKPTQPVNAVVEPAQIKQSSQSEQVSLVQSAPKPELFLISQQDTNLRLLLTRWGKQVSPAWEVVWQYPKDIPLAGTASLKENNFKAAALYISSLSSQSGDAVRPCFYTNNVVRIIPKTNLCDPLKDAK